MSYLPFVFVLIAVIALLVFSARARRRQAAAEEQRAAGIVVGTEVMTTSGLYGTVVAINSEDGADNGADDSVLLAIAPGVEVRWAFAALRTIDSLPERYRGSDTPGLGQDSGLGKA